MKLWLIRHAKSSWADSGKADFDRPLNNRGERDGVAMSRWLSEQQHPAEWIWTSDARRTLATSEFVRAGFALGKDQVQQLHQLYLGGVGEMLEVIRGTPPDIKSVAVVAHNPGTTYLLNLLTGEPVTDNVPTFGVARLNLPGSWPDLQQGSCELELFVTPRSLP